MSKSRLLMISEVARILRISPQAVRNKEREGLLSSRRTLGGHRRFALDQILSYRDELLNAECRGAAMGRELFKLKVSAKAKGDGNGTSDAHR